MTALQVVLVALVTIVLALLILAGAIQLAVRRHVRSRNGL